MCDDALDLKSVEPFIGRIDQIIFIRRFFYKSSETVYLWLKTSNRKINLSNLGLRIAQYTTLYARFVIILSTITKLYFVILHTPHISHEYYI